MVYLKPWLAIYATRAANHPEVEVLRIEATGRHGSWILIDRMALSSVSLRGYRHKTRFRAPEHRSTRGTLNQGRNNCICVGARAAWVRNVSDKTALAILFRYLP